MAEGHQFENCQMRSQQPFDRFLLRKAMLSAVYAVVVCLCVSVSHTPVLYQNG